MSNLIEIDYIHSNKYLQRGFEYFFVFVIVEHSEVKESQYAQYVEISHIYIYIYHIYIYLLQSRYNNNVWLKTHLRSY